MRSDLCCCCCGCCCQGLWCWCRQACRGAADAGLQLCVACAAQSCCCCCLKCVLLVAMPWLLPCAASPAASKRFPAAECAYVSSIVRSSPHSSSDLQGGLCRFVVLTKLAASSQANYIDLKLLQLSHGACAAPARPAPMGTDLWRKMQHLTFGRCWYQPKKDIFKS